MNKRDSTQFEQIMALVGNGGSLVKAVNQIRGERK